MARIPVGLQLYSVRHDLARDVAGTLQAVANMGYTGVEFFGMPQQSAADLKTMLDNVDMVCCGWHVPYALLQDDKLAETTAFHKTLDNNKLIIPGLPKEITQSRADWLKVAAFVNTLADKLADHGMVTGYHNHWTEFTPLDGENPWDTFFGNTKESVVMQLDTGNGAAGGADVVGILQKYPGRALTVHIKPYSFSAGVESREAGFRPVVGEDELPWDAIFNLCETVGGTEWYIVEYESDAYPPLEAVDRCLQALRGLGK
ncbi:MAG: TIM barrel protein [Caldilineaceae bacterium]|nr:TIM barrel protein [Caldilineaceae bacterium]MCB0144954.1 TIM barrel protein [Caldilineaceae bacterium]